MTIIPALFGYLADGTPVHEHTIGRGRLSASIIGYGAAIRDLWLEGAGGRKSVVLGFASLADYVDHSPHFGCIAGRCANRIRDGRFNLAGRAVQLSTNLEGRHHIHGGFAGFGRRAWTMMETSSTSVTLELVSADGDEGYPGNLVARCRYGVSGEDTLRIDLSATTDAPTLVNLAPHSYFNLDGSVSILSHRLALFADRYTPTDNDAFPTGALAPVAGTRFDFRQRQPVSRSVANGDSLDHNFALADAPRTLPRLAAHLEAAGGDLSLEISTTEPGLQVYDGSWLAVPVVGHNGRRAGRHNGICLEPQRFPDAIHHPHFPDAVLWPGQEYKQRTEYRFL